MTETRGKTDLIRAPATMLELSRNTFCECKWGSKGKGRVKQAWKRRVLAS